MAYLPYYWLYFPSSFSSNRPLALFGCTCTKCFMQLLILSALNDKTVFHFVFVVFIFAALLNKTVFHFVLFVVFILVALLDKTVNILLLEWRRDSQNNRNETVKTVRCTRITRMYIRTIHRTCWTCSKHKSVIKTDGSCKSSHSTLIPINLGSKFLFAKERVSTHPSLVEESHTIYHIYSTSVSRGRNGFTLASHSD